MLGRISIYGISNSIFLIIIML